MNRFKFMDNYSIKSKLLIISVFCVLIPMIITDSIVYFTIKYSIVKEQKINMDYAIDRVKYDLEGVLDNCVLVSNHLHRDAILNDFINTRYDNVLQYYEKYNSLLQNNAINYYYNSQHVYQVIVYTDNDTITNSNNFRKLTPEVMESEWYKKFYDNGEKMTISVYYDNVKKAINTDTDTARTISIARKLDEFGSKNENILKIDVDYNAIFNDMLNEKIDGNMYICNENYILFSNKASGAGLSQFYSIDSIEEKAIKSESYFNFKIANETWKIIVTEDEINPLAQIVERKGILIGLIIFNLLLPTIIISLVSHSIRGRVTLLGVYLGKIENEEFYTIECNNGKDEISNLIRSYNLMVLKIKELIEVVFKRDAEKQRLELAKKQAELKALQSQVNPHFMFNTLESIRMRSLIKGEGETADIIEKLSILLRTTINWGEDYISIEEEMLFVENYLQIQKYRFGDKLSFGFYVMEECKKIKIPKLSILGFIENACVHGIEEVSHNANINVTIFKEQNILILEITDTGSGIDKKQLKLIRDKLKDADIDMLNNSKSTGIFNTYMRLQMYCNNNMQFEIDSRLNEGTEITIQIYLDELRKTIM